MTLLTRFSVILIVALMIGCQVDDESIDNQPFSEKHRPQ
jgi:hypothetical protein